MQLEVGTHLAALLVAAPWATLAVVVFWPDNGVAALLVKRSQAVRVAEIERERTRADVNVELKKGDTQAQLPAPIGEKE